jgi:hypothetical protein
MERCAESLGYRISVVHEYDPGPNPGPAVAYASAHEEYWAVRDQHPILCSNLKNDLEKIPQTELSCRRVIDATYQSDFFMVFSKFSKYFKPKFNSESFARSMAHGASKLMDIAYITENEAHLHLFCTLSCISFANIDAKVSRVDTARISEGIIRFFYKEPKSIREFFREVTVTNLENLENREVTTKFIPASTFKSAEMCVSSSGNFANAT